MRAVGRCLVLLVILSTGNVNVFGSRLLSNQQRLRSRSSGGHNMGDVSELGYQEGESSYYATRPDRPSHMNSGTLGQFSPDYAEGQLDGRGGLTDREYVITPSYDNQQYEVQRPRQSYSNHRGYPRDQIPFESDGDFNRPTRRNRYSDSKRPTYGSLDIEMGRYHEDKPRRTYDRRTGNVNIRLVADNGGRNERRPQGDDYHSHFDSDINDRRYDERDDVNNNRYYRPEDIYAEGFNRHREAPKVYADKSRGDVSPNTYRSPPPRPSRRQHKTVVKGYKESGKTTCKTGDTAPFSRSARHYKMCTFDHFIVRQCAPGTEFCADLGICCAKETSRDGGYEVGSRAPTSSYHGDENDDDDVKLGVDGYEFDSRRPVSSYHGDESDDDLNIGVDGYEFGSRKPVSSYHGDESDDDVNDAYGRYGDDSGDVYAQYGENGGGFEMSSTYGDIGVLKKNIHIKKASEKTTKYKKGYSMGSVQKGTSDIETVAQGTGGGEKVTETAVKNTPTKGLQDAGNNIYTGENEAPSSDNTYSRVQI